MIRSGQTFSGQIDNPLDILAGYPADAAEVFVASADAIRPQALAALGVTPGPVKYPIEWTLSPLPSGRSPNMPGGRYSKQKAAFFATDGFGKGIPFVRASHGPGNIQNAWQFRADTGNVSASVNGQDVTFKATILNNDPASQFVYGSLAKSNPGRFQQQFHKNTGWLNEYQEVTFWLNAFGVLYRKNLRKKFADRARDYQTKRRAFTRRVKG